VYRTQSSFQTKLAIALEQIRRARQRGILQGVALADAGYGADTSFRTALTKLEMTYVMGSQSTATVRRPGQGPKPAPARQGDTGGPRKLLQRGPSINQCQPKNLRCP
jgi:SRSO17 transposase